MRFILVADDLGLNHDTPNRLPKTIMRSGGEKKTTRERGDQFELDLFDFVSADQFNTLEQCVATYLDEQENLLLFWYRNRSRRDYAIQGWKRHRIYADFIFASKAEDSPEEFDRVFVVETKGLHLGKFADTDYKRSVFGLCNEHARKKTWSEFVPAMNSTIMQFEVVDEPEWQKRLTGLLTGKS
jgi:type III restriction enzyme